MIYLKWLGHPAYAPGYEQADLVLSREEDAAFPLSTGLWQRVEEPVEPAPDDAPAAAEEPQQAAKRRR